MTSLPDGKAHQQILGSTDFGCATYSRRKKDEMIIEFTSLGQASKEFIMEIRDELYRHIRLDGRFRLPDVNPRGIGSVEQVYHGRGKARKPHWRIVIKGVRLTTAKPYCGQHPGECLINPFTGKAPKKPNDSRLEWDDWIQFNNLVNDFLDKLPHASEAWSSCPPEQMDKGRKFYFRRNNQRRIYWDWTEGEYVIRKQKMWVRIWNHGTPDQFRENMYEHDCKGCFFLGRFVSPENKEPFDLYFCRRCDGGSCIARYGNEGGEYSSFPVSEILVLEKEINAGREHSSFSRALIEAKNRANKKKGLTYEVAA
jgi:hypothetical protein